MDKIQPENRAAAESVPCKQYHAVRSKQPIEPFTLSLTRSGTRAERGAWQPGLYENRYNDQNDSVPAAGRAIARRAQVGSPDLSGYSPSRLNSVAEGENGASDRNGSLYSNQPASIGLTNALSRRECSFRATVWLTAVYSKMILL